MRSALGALATTLLFVVLVAPAWAQNEDLERRRLQLDIDRLKRESADLAVWAPRVSLAIAIVAAVLGGVRYLDERKRARQVRTEEEVARNLERLIDKPSDGSSTNARWIAALRTLDAITKTRVDSNSDEHRKRVTDAVTAIVRDDLRVFTTPDEARMPVICADEWREFRALAEDDEELCRIVIGRYLDQLSELRTEEPVYVNEVVSEKGRYVHPTDALRAPADEMFDRVVTGFRYWVRFLPTGPVRDKAIERFKSLAAAHGSQLFGDEQPAAAVAPEGGVSRAGT